MNLPNKITMFRILLIPFFIVFLLSAGIPGHQYIALGIFVVASLTDTLDGYIARKYHLITNFGKFMDPLADKLLVSSAIICFLVVPQNPMPVWAVLIIIGRDFIISGFRLVASDAGVVIAADYWGKVKTVVQMVMSILLILNLPFTVYIYVEKGFIYLSVLLTVISLAECLRKNWNIIGDSH
jgi:CDP-diacylglycerol--glycerol-3-phosphate 3-phosphatidyltransferase